MFQRAILIAACLPLLAGAATPQANTARHVYLLRLSGPPLVEHLQAQIAAQPRAAVAGHDDTAAVRQKLDSPEAMAYLRSLDDEREQVIRAGSADLGRTLKPRAVYRYASNGMALALTDAEAARIARLPGVAGVRRERMQRWLTDVGPQWIGADKVWNGQVAGAGKTKGEGVVIGIIDTGISPTHPSFAATGPDGYTITNSRGHYYGLCASAQATCNSKLIGIYDFTDEGTNGIDSVGHGTHVAGIAAGDAMSNALAGTTISLPRNVSGVAPHANIIMYKACVAGTADDPEGGCPESSLVQAIDQAVRDEVDVINYSIGGDAEDAFVMLNQGNNDAAAMFNARAAGVVVVAAAGNDGPDPGTLGEPGNVPWVIGVANSSHNRRFANSVGSFSGAANPPPTLGGQGYTAGYGPAEIVYAGDFGNALCGIGETDYPPTGKSNPFAPNTFHGQIVVCDRGTYARVEKGYNVLHAGAGGYILANAQSDGESTISDDHYLPAVHLGYTEGQQLKQWLTTPGSHMGKIAGVSADLNDSYGDVLESSSSRGPYGFGGGILKPDITAPGTNILSSDYHSDGLAFMTGTSMASPHVAGAAALLLAAHPNWTPSQVESALIGTALPNSVRKEDGVTLATPLDAGAGRTRVDAAIKAGLYFPLSAGQLRNANPSRGGNPADINRPGIESENCLGTCTFTRTVMDMSGGGAWNVSVQNASPDAQISVSPNQFTLASSGTQTLTITANVGSANLAGTWAYARIVLHKTSGGTSATDTAMNLAVYSPAGDAPAFREFTLNGPRGSQLLQVNGLDALPQATFTATDLVPATVTNMSLGVDANSDDIYTTFPGTGKQFVLFDNPNDSFPEATTYGSAFIVEIDSSSAPQADLYVGIDENGDGKPSLAEQECKASRVSGATARCVIDLRHAGAVKVWMLVDIPKTNPAGNYTVKLNSGIPAVHYNWQTGILGSFGVVGPGHVAEDAQFPLRLIWDGPSFNVATSSGRFFGAVLIDPAPTTVVSDLGDEGFVPFALTRIAGGNDVVDPLVSSQSRDVTLEPGESSTHRFIDVPAQATLLINSGYIVDSSDRAPVSFRLTRADFPASSAAPDVAAAPPLASGDAQWTLGGTAASQSITVPVDAGRWYIVATNKGTGSADFFISVQINSLSPVTPPVMGAYYNPQRPGHGIFMNQASGQQAVYWYAYLEDGTPIWYQAVEIVPDTNNASWFAPLMQYNWDGSQINASMNVGTAIITPINATDYMFSWQLYGQGGSERFTLLGADSCVPFGGGNADFTGQWYAPAESGYGVDVLGLPNLQNDTFYLYDALGQARWLAGSVDAFTASTTVPLSQYSGFCPRCAYVPATAANVGNLSISYSNANAGNYATNLTLQSPLSGTWTINQPIVRLTGKTTCP
jgi:subtilisin family serine protease